MLLREAFEKQGNHLFKRRGILPVFLLLVIIGLFYRNITTHALPAVFFTYVCFMISILGLLLRIITVAFVPDHTSGRNTGKQKAKELNTTGLYSLCRNPLYLGNFLVWLGIVILTHNWWFVAIYTLLFWIYYERIVFAEEQYLETKFGQQYRDWAASTPVFIPRFLRWRKPEYPFSWIKVFREKNTLLSISLIFWLYAAMIDYHQRDELTQPTKWNILLVLSMLLYVILRVARRIREGT